MPDSKPKKSIDLYATSTIAMSILNLLAVGRCEIPFDPIFMELKSQHPGLERYLIDRAIEQLAERGLIVKSDVGYRCAKPNQTIVVTRDRSDFSINHETGEQEGGWSGWAGPLRNAPVFSVGPVMAGGAQ